MSNIQRYPIISSFAARYQARTGFDVTDPDRRHPVRNDLPDRLQAVRDGRSPDLASQLLKGRQNNSQQRVRGLGWGVLLIGLFGTPQRAQAHHHYLPYDEPTVHAAPSSTGTQIWADWAWNALDALNGIELPQMAVLLGASAGYLAVQTLAMRQRRQILKALSSLGNGEISKAGADPIANNAHDEKRILGSSSDFTWQTDAATRQGKVRGENQDAYQVLQLDEGHIALIVCDGAGGIEGGRAASQSAVKAISKHLTETFAEHNCLSERDLENAIEDARLASVKEAQQGVTTALVVYVHGDQMFYATLGDGEVAVIFPDGMVGHVQIPHHTAGKPSNIINAYIGDSCNVPPRIGRLRLENGTFVMAMSDGVSDLLPLDDIAKDRKKYANIVGLADHFLAYLEAARDSDTGAYLHSDNMTLAMARLSAIHPGEGGADDTSH